MKLTSKTKLNDRVMDHPFLQDFLMGLSPRFEKLRDPVLRRTLGRAATLSQVAGFGDMPLATLLAALAGEIKRVKGGDVSFEMSDTNAGGAGTASASGPAGKVALDTGALSPEQANLMLKHLPLDISYVDENDTVVYYSDTAERIFTRVPAVIGRKVQNCHPSSSVHVVNRILDAFRKGERSSADFWIALGGRFILIRYFAIRDAQGTYRGCLEVSQDVTSVRALQGQKRLLDWE